MDGCYLPLETTGSFLSLFPKAVLIAASHEQCKPEIQPRIIIIMSVTPQELLELINNEIHESLQRVLANHQDHQKYVWHR